jgi:GNAT superfamily N-acetyltransferase
MEIRNAHESEIDALAELWYDGWQDAHAAVVPAELKQLRSRESFTERMGKMLPNVRTVGPVGMPLGFYVNKADELYQLFVSAEARGKGVAAALIADSEARLREGGFETVWLACAIGNERAARFYEKSGWTRTGTFVSEIPIGDGIFPLEVWRYEKSLKT